MTKKEQAQENAIVKAVFDTGITKDKVLRTRRLRTCSAYVLETETAFLLQSYNTIVAVLIKDSHILYDGLRLVYGFTATSAQHISKFGRDYGVDKKYTWR